MNVNNGNITMNLLDHWTDLENYSYLSDGCELEYFEGGGD